MVEKKKVTLFIQCLVDSMYPEVGHAMVRLLDRLGVAVEVPLNQTCCGQPAFNSGYRTQARTAAKKFIEIFENAETIVCPSGSCVDMVKHQYPGLFEDGSFWQDRATAVSGNFTILHPILRFWITLMIFHRWWPGRDGRCDPWQYTN